MMMGQCTHREANGEERRRESHTKGQRRREERTGAESGSVQQEQGGAAHSERPRPVRSGAPLPMVGVLQMTLPRSHGLLASSLSLALHQANEWREEDPGRDPTKKNTFLQHQQNNDSAQSLPNGRMAQREGVLTLPTQLKAGSTL